MKYFMGTLFGGNRPIKTRQGFGGAITSCQADKDFFWNENLGRGRFLRILAQVFTISLTNSTIFQFARL